MYIVRFNKPTVRNVSAEIGIYLIWLVGIGIYYRYFRATVPVWHFVYLWLTAAVLGGCLEYFSGRFYDYITPLTSWFNMDDYSLSFSLCYGSAFSIVHLWSGSLIQAWHLSGWLAWIFPNFILAMLVVGSIDIVFHRFIKFYEFDPSYYPYLTNMFKIVRTPWVAWTIPVFDLPVGVLVFGYGLTFGVALYNLNRLVLWLFR